MLTIESEHMNHLYSHQASRAEKSQSQINEDELKIQETQVQYEIHGEEHKQINKGDASKKLKLRDISEGVTDKRAFKEADPFVIYFISIITLTVHVAFSLYFSRLTYRINMNNNMYPTPHYPNPPYPNPNYPVHANSNFQTKNIQHI